jgi:hypothetical protein
MRTEAQKRADKRYRQKNKGKDVTWGVTLPVEEANNINALLREKQLKKTDFIRQAVKRLKEGE